MRSISLIVVAFAAVLVAPSSALAQESGADPAAVSKADAATSLVEFENVMKAAGCRAEAVTDPRFVADAKNAIRPVIHDEDSRAMLTDRKHVVMAYAAILALLIVFVVLLALRQQRLGADIQRLSDELDQALKDD